MILHYKGNRAGTLQAAYSGSVRVGYVEQSRIGDDTNRWIWSLNTIQPKGGRASGIETTEVLAKDALDHQWVLWLEAAGLTFKEQRNAEPERPSDRAEA